MYQYKEKKSEKEKKPEPNRTGIPDDMKNRMEYTSGVSFDDVRVHYHSEKPKTIQALAYTQGNQVYLGPGSERHLPHELGHVVQQKLGMVRPNARTRHGAALNTEARLEHQADEIGAAHGKISGSAEKNSAGQGNAPIQRKIGMEFQTYKGEWNVKKLTKSENEARVERKMRAEDTTYLDMLSSAGRALLYEEAGVGYEMTSDGSDLEYITKAYNEEVADERVKLADAAKAAGELHGTISGGTPKFAHVKVGEFLKVTADGDTYYINKKGEKTAHPQATVGIEYEKISALADRITSASGRDIFYQDVSTANISRSQLKTIKKKSDDFMKEKKDAGAEPHEKERCASFILLADQYLSAVVPRYKKNQKAYTSAKAGMNALIEAVKAKIREADELESLGGDKRILPTVYTGFLTKAGRIEVLRNTFLDEIADEDQIAERIKNLDKEYKDVRVRERNDTKIRWRGLDIEENMRAWIANQEKKIQEHKTIIEEKSERIRTLRAQLSENQAELRQLETEVAALRREVAALTGKDKQSVSEKKQKNDSIRAKGTEIKNKNTAITSLSNSLKKAEDVIRNSNEAVTQIEESIKGMNVKLERFLSNRDAILDKWGDILDDSGTLIQQIHVSAHACEPAIIIDETSHNNTKAEYLTYCYHELLDYLKVHEHLLKSSLIRGKRKKMIEKAPICSEKYFKTLLSMKTRTSMYDLFYKLDDNDRAFVFEYLDKHYTDDALIWEDKDKCVRYKEWKEKLHKGVGGTDLASYELEDNNRRRDGYKRDFGVTRSTDIGHDTGTGEAEKVDGAILELRKLKGNIPASKWGETAEKVAQAVYDIHHPTQPK